jgi:ribosome recycling factor
VINEVLAEAEQKMNLVVDHTAGEFGTVRTGRANPSLLHKITVDYYGTKTPLRQIAGLSVPEAQTLLVQPYDRSALADIERAILEANLDLSPSNDGNVIRLAFPALTEERRKDLIRVVRHTAEEGRIAIRNVRRHAKGDMEALKGDVSDDDIHRGEKELQDLTQRLVLRVDELLSHKEAELLQI